jgi:hypothetical protein
MRRFPAYCLTDLEQKSKKGNDLRSYSNPTSVNGFMRLGDVMVVLESVRVILLHSAALPG